MYEDNLSSSIEIPAQELQRLCASETAARLLEPAEFRVAQTYQEFVSWVERKQEGMRESDETRRIFRLCGSPYKEFREEVLPFRVLADHVIQGTTATIEFPLDSGNRDVIVRGLNGDGSVQLIEISNAGWDYEQRLRMEMLSFRGNAPGLGPIVKEKRTKAGYRINAEGMAQELNGVVNTCIERILDLLQRKNGKVYEAGTWLVVAFDNNPLFDESDYRSVVEAVAISTRNVQFDRVYLVAGTSFCHRVR